METVRFLNKGINQNERGNFASWWREQIDLFGQMTTYYSANVALSAMHYLYGEQPDLSFDGGKNLVMILNLNNDSYLLSKFGILADSDVTGAIHPSHFTALYGLSSEPRPGDLVKLEEFGNDRLNFPRRGPTVYEITEVIDEFQFNPIAGHYVWFFKAKRYDYSYENNSPGSGQGNTPSNDNDIIEQAAQENFNYIEDNPCSDTSVYGEY